MKTKHIGFLTIFAALVSGMMLAVVFGLFDEPSRAMTGSSWQVAWKSTGEVYDFHAFDDHTAIGVGSDGMVIRTEDGGVSWRYLSVDARFDLRSVDFTSPRQGLAVGDGGVLFRTEDGGETWLPDDTGAGVDLFALDMIDEQHGWAAGAQGRLLYTEDGGHTWRPVTSGVSTDLHGLAFFDDLRGWVVGDDGVILHTEDGGHTWQRQIIQVHTDLRAVTFETAYRGWAVGSDGVILGTVNSGGVWTAASDTGFPTSFFQDVDCVSGVCYVVGSAGATLRYDGSWHRFYDLNDENRTLYAVQALDKRRAWSAGARHTADVEFNDSALEYDAWGVFLTTNGAAHWTLQVGDLFPRFRKLDFVNDQVGYVVGGDWSYRRTTDGGRTWSQFQAPPPDKKAHQFYYDVDCLSPDDCYFVGRYGVVRRTTDGGVTWQDQGIIDSPTGIGRGYGKFLYAVKMQDERNAFAGGSYRLFFTDDGYHWRRAATANGDVFDIETLGDGDGMAATSTNYFLSRNAEGGWYQRSTRIGDVRLYGVDVKDSDHDGRVDKAWLAGCKSSRCSETAVVIYTDDGEGNWSRAQVDPGIGQLLDISMADELHGWAVGEQGAILYTADGGRSWKKTYSPVDTRLESVQALDKDIAFASGWEGVILRYGDSPLAFNARPRHYDDVIDGHLTEWLDGDDVVMKIDAVLAYHWEASDGQAPAFDDASAELRMRWQEDQLVLAVDVRDDGVTSEDSIGLALDGRNDNLWGDDDLTFIVHSDGRMEGAPTGVRVVARANDHGYQMEIGVPAALLGDGLHRGGGVGLNFQLHDVDGDGGSALLVWTAPELVGMPEAPDRFADIALAPFDEQNRGLTAFAAAGQIVDGDLSDWDDLSALTLDTGAADSQYGPDTTANAHLQLQWQPQGLLGALRVNDADIRDGDSVILALDGDGDGKNDGAQDMILTFTPNGLQTPVAGVISFVSGDDDGYHAEFFIPVQLLGGDLAHGRQMGVNLSLIDATVGAEKSVLIWEGATPAANFGDFGRLVISDRLLALQEGQAGFTGVLDANLDGFHPTDNFAHAPVHAWRGNPNKSTVIRFPLDDIPAQATVTGGSLWFWVIRADEEPLQAAVYALRRDWDINAVSWSFARTGERWEVAGAQGAADRYTPATDVEPLSKEGWIHFDVGADLVAMSLGQRENRGWLIETTGAFSQFQVAASEYAAPVYRPKLIVRYVLPVGEQPTPTPTLTPTSTPSPTPTPLLRFLPLLLHKYEIPPVLLPDLAPLDMHIDTETSMTCTDASHPAILGVRARFINQGTAPAGAFVIQLNGVRKSWPNLPVNAEGEFWTPGFSIGQNRLQLDVDEQVMELSEGNNTLVQTLPIPTPLPTCTPAP